MHPDDTANANAIVDHVQRLVGGTCTIFQRMNRAGDMLRISTNVRLEDGSRAIGTFIPAINPDGTPNAVVSTVMGGETYRGEAEVVGKMCRTAYQPLRDEMGQIMGMLYVGREIEDFARARDTAKYNNSLKLGLPLRLLRKVNVEANSLYRDKARMMERMFGNHVT